MKLILRVFISIVLLIYLATFQTANAHNEECDGFSYCRQKINFLHSINSTADDELRFKRISLEDGLSQSVVRAIMQDRHGFMWFATEEGLNKYDGYTFTVFKHDPNDPLTLSNNVIYSLAEDNVGALWVGTEHGLNRLDPITETFTRYQHDPENPNSLSGNFIWSVYVDRHGTLWVGTSDGLNRFDSQTETFTVYQHNPNNSHSLSNDLITTIAEDAQGQLWLGTDDGLNCFDSDTEQFTRYYYDSKNLLGLSDDVINAITLGHDGILWIGTFNGGLNKFDPDTETFTSYQHDHDKPSSISDNLVWSVYEDRQGIIWAGTLGGGLNRFDPDTETFMVYQHNPTKPYSLGNNIVYSIYQDAGGVSWIGTEDGLSLWSLKKFTTYQHDNNDPHSLSNNLVMPIFEDHEGFIWLGTYKGGLNRFDPNTKNFTVYRHDPNNLTSLSSNAVWSIYEDSHQVLWIGTDNGLSRFDRDTETFFTYHPNRYDPSSLSNNFVFALTEDAHGQLWVGTDYGLSRFNRDTETFTTYYHDSTQPLPFEMEEQGVRSGSLSDNIINTIVSSHDGGLWIGTGLGGLNHFEFESETFTIYRHDPNNPDSLSNDLIWTVYEDDKGILWIGTDGGLNKLDSDGKFKHYRVQHGLPSDAVLGILADESSNLWLSTTAGLSKFDPVRETFRNYDVSDGLQSNQFNRSAYHKTKKGNMYFGGLRGVSMFHPDHVKDNPYNPPIVLTKFRLFNMPQKVGSERGLMQKPIWDTDSMTLSYQDYIVSFEFSALSYAVPDKNRYRYMLENYETEWNEVDSKRRFATYTSLPAGNYTFRVRGANNDGIFSHDEVALSITVTPPWWETALFRWSMILLSVMAIFTAYQWRTRQIIAQNRKLSVLVNEKTKDLTKANLELVGAKVEAETAKNKAEVASHAKSVFLANMSHELRTPLNGILGYAQILKRQSTITENQRHGLNIIEQSGDHLLNLINEVLDLAKIESGKLELYETDFHFPNFLQNIVEIIRIKAETQNIYFRYELMNDNDPLPVGVHGDEKYLRQILINLLGNAVKFTDEGGVTFKVGYLNKLEAYSTEHRRIMFRIEDTGAGIAPEDLDSIFKPFHQVGDKEHKIKGTGLGLAISQNLIHLMGGEFQVESTLGEGSTFWFDIMLPPAHDVVQSSALSKKEIIGFKGDIKTILVVDDKWENRAFLMELLSTVGFNVITAQDGYEGLAKAEAHQPDIIITDFVMPRLDGVEMTRRIRESALLCDTIVFITSASVFAKDRQKSKIAGGNAFIPKPIKVNVLFDLLHQHSNIEWVYQQTEGHEDTTESHDPSSIILPSSDILTKLLEFGMIGDVESILDEARRIADMDKQLTPFSTQIQKLAKGFQVNRICSLLEEYLER